ncbi:hypothetical protein CVIRNUC_007569 [Coccomyxa viridis]|uniref:Uncharacterized protein n=1 Tax=Coccomyxa viridis TaxID=1274662 RepID=A0AAV1IDN8_9CHLO|nr:hypothetical protein CVIRNUC_007569 [Coccomyxa viridis]
MQCAAAFSVVVTVVCLVALTSGKMHCLLDAKHCGDIGEGGAAQALLPPAGARPGALAHRTLSSNPTVREKCAAQGPVIPRVAFLFMTRGTVVHEPMWKEWFRSAVGLIPIDVIRNHNCSESVFSDIASACIPDQNPQNILGSQHLFSVYIHIPPGQPGHPKGSLFHGLEIPVHIKASWGGFELVDIAKALFGAALQDPANQKMVLLSESCLPLYPPTLTYAQLISEPKSRINACSNEGARWQAMPWRWHPKMARAKDAQITPALWRKTSQWIALERELAAAVAGDTAVANMFRQSCLEVDWDDELERHYECYSDEHYMPVLLAFKGLENKTDCVGSLTNVDWSENKPHPWSYTPEEVNVATIRRLRAREGCYPAAALRLAKHVFMEAGAPQSDSYCRAGAPWAPVLLGPHCSLIARKFPENTASQVHALYSNCSADLGMLGCPGDDLVFGQQL